MIKSFHTGLFREFIEYYEEYIANWIARTYKDDYDKFNADALLNELTLDKNI